MEQHRPAAQGKLIARIVFGVFGNKQHGKDTVSDSITMAARGAGLRARKIALADPLKHCAMHLVGMPPEVAFGEGANTEEREKRRQEWTAYGKNGRQWLQWIGTELGRNQVSPDLWIDRTVDRIASDDQGIAVWAISDCRFHNEREKLAQKLTDRFIRFVKVRVKRDWPVDLAHPSESEVASMPDDLFDIVLTNNGSLIDLGNQVVQGMRKLTGNILA